MTKTFEINGRTFAVVPYISDENCYRLVALESHDDDPNDDFFTITVLDDPACEDYYGDIDTVANFMKEAIREEAEKPYPWWTLIQALFEWGGDAEYITTKEQAKKAADVINNATIIRTVDMENEEEAGIAKEKLGLCTPIGYEVIIHTFVNGSAGSFSLAEEWS